MLPSVRTLERILPTIDLLEAAGVEPGSNLQASLPRFMIDWQT